MFMMIQNWSITLKDSDNHTLLDGVSGHSFNTLKYGWKPGSIMYRYDIVILEKKMITCL